MSTTMNYTYATGAHTNNDESSIMPLEGETHRINFYPAMNKSSTLIKRGTLGSSQPAGNNNVGKRR